MTAISADDLEYELGKVVNMANEQVTVTAEISRPIKEVWSLWTEPEHVQKWNFASDDWCCPRATNDLRNGGSFNYRMESKDGSFGFDLEGVYTDVVDQQRIAFTMSDGRSVETTFAENGETVTVTTVFDAESENPVEMQRDGWQAILNNFRKYTEDR